MRDPSPSGCLPAPIARLMGLSRATPALPDGLVLPTLDTSKVHPTDLPVLIRVRNTARSCHQRLRRADMATSASVDASRELVGWVGSLYRVGQRLQDARGFVIAHAPEEMARAKADLELELLEAGVERIPALKQQMAALQQRQLHAASVTGEITSLSDRLATAAGELEALSARLEADLGSEALLHEVRAWHQSTELALSAFAETVGELS